MGINSIGDVLAHHETFKPWIGVHPGGGDRLGEWAYQALISNLHGFPIINSTAGLHSVFLEEESSNQTKRV